MTVTPSQASELRSLMTEAGRQTSYYSRLNQNHLAVFWAEIESLAYDARRHGMELRLIVSSSMERSTLLSPVNKANNSVTPFPKGGSNEETGE